jgi:hypothetical protein
MYASTLHGIYVEIFLNADNFKKRAHYLLSSKFLYEKISIWSIYNEIGYKANDVFG